MAEFNPPRQAGIGHEKIVGRLGETAVRSASHRDALQLAAQQLTTPMNPPPLPRPRKFPWIIYWIVLVLIAILAFAPIASVVACSVIANANGCRVDEGSVHPCVINGKDYGQMLYTLGVMGWLMLLTLPAGAVAFGVWLVVLLLHHASWRKRGVSA